MKPGIAPPFFLRWLLAAIVLGAVASPSRGDDPPPSPAARTPQQTASLEALDRAISRFDALLARDDDARHQAATQAVFAGLKKRRDALQGAFDQSKYDDLRTELGLEYQRLAAWVGPAPAVPPPAKAGSTASGR